MLSRFLSMYVPLALASSIILAATSGAMAQSSPGATNKLLAMQSMADVPCAQADHAMMSGIAEMKSMMPSTGDLDKDFMGMVTMNDNAMMGMAKLEMRCGKTASTKLAAQRYMLNLQRRHRYSGDSG